ncbi:hypothetical protein Q4S45_03440 [Massilia sp. R2A-15]|uniref:hypothetical protein n=1 Tax=Massilia sp. R2A-15 TaxID=3064278 RepID=UPI00273427A1|nr:hypothetical protein [Massilia sp. R2A-15]WLI90191.1 hypothetical protein Q4S45_03440 [Massilia sp. R2A-15]
MRGSRRVLMAMAIGALAGALAWLARGDRTATAPAQSTTLAAPARAERPSAPPVAAAPALIRRQLVEDLRLADYTYCSYRESSKYPHDSRPVSEQPDQVYPNAPVTGSHALRLEGGDTDPGVQIQTSQTRVHLAAGETVAFSLRALDAAGRALPLVVTRAVAQGLPVPGRRPGAQATLAFADAGDGALAATLAPAQSGLAAFAGTIRADVRYRVAGRAGVVLFDVIYSPEAPGAWTGQVREAVENGSLNFYLGADIRHAGRYIVTGRVDDASGRPFAVVTFNDMLGEGANDVRLTVFGKLLRDGEPALPLSLRDVDGYLLKENTDPDRELMPRLEGRTAVAAHPLSAFSDAEWQSEERSRYLAEFGRSRDKARAALAAFDPQAELPPSGCAVNRANQR